MSKLGTSLCHLRLFTEDMTDSQRKKMLKNRPYHAEQRKTKTNETQSWIESVVILKGDVTHKQLSSDIILLSNNIKWARTLHPISFFGPCLQTYVGHDRQINAFNW